MKLVRPTHPPRMAVIVDTVLGGEVELALQRADPVYERIDSICVEHNSLRIYTGVPAYLPAAPNLQGRRLLATIYVPHGISQIMHHHIRQPI